MRATYSKSMIELVYEIRRRVPADFKPSVKLANPDLLIELARFFPDCNDAILKALIKELMEIAGEEWQQTLTKPRKAKQTESYQFKAYRGATSVESAPSPQLAKQEPPKPASSKLVYRGCVIER